MKNLVIKGAREHNLKNISLELPRNKLVVVSGLSGSGKSSLAFDTIFAEGQRRYVESLSSYARQFLGRLDKPDVDYIEGLSPAISIEQKTTHKNPRSTVGTITEIYDYLRLLFARIGVPHCPDCGREIQEQPVDSIIEAIMSLPSGTKADILAPVIRGRKGEHQKIFTDAKSSGFTRVRVNGEYHTLDEEIVLDKRKKHSIEIVVHRLKIEPEKRREVADSVETALEVGHGKVVLVVHEKTGDREEFFSQISACPDCNISIPELQPRLFSFNNPYGACEECSGLGITMEFDPQKVIPDLSLSFNQQGIAPYNPAANWYRSSIQGFADHFGFTLDTPLGELPDHVMRALLYGTEEAIDVTYVNKKQTGRFEFSSKFKGILNELKRRYLESASDEVKEWMENYMSQKVCHSCEGKRLKRESLAVRVSSKNIYELSIMTIEEATNFFKTMNINETQRTIAKQILKEIEARLSFMVSVGLNYLTLERRAATLSGGEAQRIRLATQIGSQLVGVLYILDEPTIGLHQRDNDRLLETLIHLRDLGNTLIVVEHDEQTLRMADYIVDLGPGAGVHGGYVVAQGTCEEVMKNGKSLTGRYLAGTLTIDQREERRKGNGKSLVVKGAREHNLKNIDVSFPLGTLSVITGVSGSGKSTLLTDILYPACMNSLGRSRLLTGEHEEILGLEEIDSIINIDQSPIGRTPRSNPATYVGLFTPIRDLFASLPESKAKGYKSGRFSFNVKGGRCENCQGAGTIKIEMHFLPDVYITCDVCKGKRYNHETLEIRYKGKNIYEILNMTIEDGAKFFDKIPQISRRLETLNSVGMGYIKLGQSAITLSGGEAQRIKLAFELSKRNTGKTLYLLDEPTTGLHFADVKKLLEVLQRLVDGGNTVILIEHNLDVIKQADYIVDLGPEGGDKGGELVAAGTPEEVVACKKSYTGKYLKDVLEK
ncbi:MAG: excinuclease ABC subunit UvrA [Spirochaetales bacterium]|nr:excinuclease ABC subunit UvrA [Spirochaetales bacterium]